MTINFFSIGKVYQVWLWRHHSASTIELGQEIWQRAQYLVSQQWMLKGNTEESKQTYSVPFLIIEQQVRDYTQWSGGRLLLIVHDSFVSLPNLFSSHLCFWSLNHPDVMKLICIQQTYFYLVTVKCGGTQCYQKHSIPVVQWMLLYSTQSPYQKNGQYIKNIPTWSKYKNSGNWEH